MASQQEKLLLAAALLASQQEEEPEEYEEEYEEYDEEYHSEVDKGLVAFLGTLTEWIIAAGIVFIVLAFVSNLEY